jgi:hypothetical protein
MSLGGRKGVVVQGETLRGGELTRARELIAATGVGTADTEDQVWMDTAAFVAMCNSLIEQGVIALDISTDRREVVAG